MKRNLIIAGIVLVIGVFGVTRFTTPEDGWICVDGQWVQHGNPSEERPNTGCGVVNTVSSFSFNETGHFIKDNPGLKSGVWYLSYEKPGAPALSVELEFSEVSVCEFNGKKGACPDVLLPSSAMTRVRGELKGDKVIVFDAVSGVSLRK